MAAPSTNNSVATTAQAFDDDGLAPFIDVNRTRNTARQRSGDCTTGCVTAVGFTKRSAYACAQDSRAQSFVIELISGKGLTCGQVSLVGWCWAPIKDGPIVRSTIGASSHQNQTCNGQSKLRFHYLTFLV
tara:strand:- start:513 stop:902 length:390 start_codon:yes stop_codon:yes gene_type:complete